MQSPHQDKIDTILNELYEHTEGEEPVIPEWMIPILHTYLMRASMSILGDIDMPLWMVIKDAFIHGIACGVAAKEFDLPFKR